MTPARWFLLFAVLLGTGLSVGGCGSSSTSEPSPVAESDEGGGEAPADGSASDEPADDGPFVLGDLIEPFEPPTLEELEASKSWLDRPVLHGMEIMRKLQAEAPEPELSAEEALKLRNDSPENNEKIKAALGRLAAEDGSGVDSDAAVVGLSNADMKSTNPILYSSVAEAEYHDLASIVMLTVDQNLEWFGVADVLKSWRTSEDRLVDVFVLREDLTWSDGEPLTARDFEFAFKVIMTNAVIVPTLRTGSEELKAVKAYDDHTLVVFHKEALPTRNGNMQFFPIPEHVYAETIPKDPTLARSDAHTHLEDHPVVSGPYQLVRRKRGEEFVLERRESWYMHNGVQVRAKPNFREVRMKAIEDLNTALLANINGQIEFMELRAEHWETRTNGDDFYTHNTKVTANEWSAFHFVWNVESPLFEDKRCRWAMTYAMDYEELIETICYGLYQQGQGPFHPTSWMFPEDAPELISQDLDRAQELLTEAGWEDTDGDGVLDKEVNGRKVSFEFTLLTSTTDVGIKTATLMKECLELVGVVCNVKPTEFTVLTQKNRDHEFTASIGGWLAGSDPATNENIFGTNKGRNYGSYSNTEVDRLFAEGKKEFDREERTKIYGQIHNLLWEDQPYTWLFHRNSFYAFNKRLRGYNFSPLGPFKFSPGFGSVYAESAAP